VVIAKVAAAAVVMMNAARSAATPIAPATTAPKNLIVISVASRLLSKKRPLHAGAGDDAAPHGPARTYLLRRHHAAHLALAHRCTQK
jgi:hypothetical protein